MHIYHTICQMFSPRVYDLPSYGFLAKLMVLDNDSIFASDSEGPYYFYNIHATIVPLNTPYQVHIAIEASRVHSWVRLVMTFLLQ